jgi:hypothetical protein
VKFCYCEHHNGYQEEQRKHRVFGIESKSSHNAHEHRALEVDAVPPKADVADDPLLSVPSQQPFNQKNSKNKKHKKSEKLYQTFDPPPPSHPNAKDFQCFWRCPNNTYECITLRKQCTYCMIYLGVRQTNPYVTKIVCSGSRYSSVHTGPKIRPLD